MFTLVLMLACFVNVYVTVKRDKLRIFINPEASILSIYLNFFGSFNFSNFFPFLVVCATYSDRYQRKIKGRKIRLCSVRGNSRIKWHVLVLIFFFENFSCCRTCKHCRFVNLIESLGLDLQLL